MEVGDNIKDVQPPKGWVGASQVRGYRQHPVTKQTNQLFGVVSDDETWKLLQFGMERKKGCLLQLKHLNGLDSRNGKRTEGDKHDFSKQGWEFEARGGNEVGGTLSPREHSPGS